MKLTAEHDPFVAVPNWIWQHPDLQHADVRVYIAIKHHWNRRTGQCNPAISTIAEVAQVSADHVRKSSIPRLEAAGALLVKPDLKGGRRSNHYHLLTYPQTDRASDPSAPDRAGIISPRPGLTPAPGAGIRPPKQEEEEQEGGTAAELEPDGSSAAPHHYCRTHRSFVDVPKSECPTQCQPEEATA